jgi:hypothetical protein
MILKGFCRVAEALVPNWLETMRVRRKKNAQRQHWDERIADVLSCPDNARLPRVPEAGDIVDGYQLMHNGIKVVVDGYYGDGITRLLTANRGCHEPQEEIIFAAIIATMPPGAVMVEAGAYWGFYSIWFSRVVQGSKLFLVEPIPENLVVGQRNFLANGCDGDFTLAYMGRSPGMRSDGTPIVSIQSFLAAKGLPRLNMLHADIQGCELEMLEGAKQPLGAHLIDYVFISTHSNQLNEQCADFLDARGYRLLVSVSPKESHSVDGVLVACSPVVTTPEIPVPSKKPNRSTSLYRLMNS